MILADDLGHVHVGGPVQPSAIVVLADFLEPERGPRSFSTRSALPAEVDPTTLGELERARVFAGYAGWGPGQLDGELEEGSWIVEPALPEDVFTLRPRRALERCVLGARAGPGVFALMPPDPSLNDSFRRPFDPGSDPDRTTAYRPAHFPDRASRLGNRDRLQGVTRRASARPRAIACSVSQGHGMARRGALRRGRDARRVRRRDARLNEAGLHANTTLLGEAILDPTARARNGRGPIRIVSSRRSCAQTSRSS